MKRIISLLVVMAMMLASVLAIIPVAATTPVEDNDVVVENNAADDGAGDAATEETSAEVTRFLPEAAFNAIKALYEADGANTPAYSLGVAPFVNYDATARAKFANKRLLKVWLPVKNTGTVDANGDLTATLSIVTLADLAAAPVAEYSIKINAEKYGLTSGATNVHKMIEVNLYDYNIVVGEGQAVAFAKTGDTAILAWANGGAAAIVNALKDNGAEYATVFQPNAGKSNFNPNEKFAGTAIFYDMAMIDADAEVPIEYYGTPVSTADEFKNMQVGKNYYLTADITLPTSYSPVAFSNGTFDGNGHKITLATTDGLFKHVANATFKNFVLEGPASTRGVVNSFSGSITFDNVDVKLAGITAGDVSPYVPAAWSGSFSFVFRNCDNYTPMNVASGSAAAFVAGSNTSGTITIEKCNNYASMKGGAQTGGFLGHVWTAGITIKDSNNGSADTAITVESTGNIASGFAGSGKGNFTVINSKNYANVTSATTAAGGITGSYPSSGSDFAITVDGFENYGKITAGSGQDAAGLFGKVQGGCTVNFKNVSNYGEIVGSLTGGGIIGYANGIPSVSIENCGNYANVTARYVGGIVGASHTASTTIKNAIVGSADKAITISGTEYVGGVIGSAYGTTIENAKNYATVHMTNNDSTTAPSGGMIGKLAGVGTIKNATNYGEIKADKAWAGGIVGWADNTNFYGENLTNAGKVNSKGTWKTSCGGIIGTITNANSQATLKDCVNEAGAFPNVNDNRGGMIGSSMNNGDGENFHVLTKLTFINCVNKADISANGNIGGFVGQLRCKTMVFEDCANYGNVTSYGNMPGGYAGWNGGSGEMIFTRSFNYGTITAQKENKGAAGFISGTSGYTSTFTDCVNFGTIKATGNNGTASGFATDGGTLKLVRSYNVGSISGTKATNEFCSGSPNTIDCMITGLNADLIAKLKTIPLYADIYDKTDYPLLVKAFSDATAVYKNAASTADDKAAALAGIDAAITALTTWMEVSPDAAVIGGVINVTADSLNVEGKDYIALVKNGEDVVTVWAYLTAVKEAENGFNILGGTYADGKELVEGEYTLYLVPNDAAIADVLAGEVEALATKDVVISGKAITTAEQFIAMEETGDYILGCDIVLPSSYDGSTKTFKGTFDGRGHSITLQSNKCLFYKLENATIENLTLEGGKLEGGLAHLAAGTVTFDNVKVMITSITRGWLGDDYNTMLGAFVDKALSDTKAVINFYNCVANTSVKSGANVGGFIGEATVAELNFVNCTSGVSKDSSVIRSETTWAAGQTGGGFVGTVNQGNVYFENCVNNAKVDNKCAPGGGFVGNFVRNEVENAFVAIDCVNNGSITGGDGWFYAEGGFIGYIQNGTKTTLYFEGCVNNGAISTKWSSNAGGFVGMTQDGKHLKSITFIDCTNNASFRKDGNAGGFYGQANAYNVYFENCVNNGNITSNGNNAAGFAPYLSAGNADTKYTAINCVNNGAISGSTAAGLFCGFGANGNGTTILKDCVNNGSVTGKGNTAGIVVYLRGATATLTNCVNNGNVTKTNDNVNHCVAGIAALYTESKNTTFENCVNNGAVTTTVAGDCSGIAGWGGTDNPVLFKDVYNYGYVQGHRGTFQISNRLDNMSFDGAWKELGATDTSAPLEIWTAEDFMNMRPHGKYILMDNIVLPEDYKSIVFGTNIYTGATLEGNGKTIYMKGLTSALFHELYNATIRNFNVVGTLTFNGDGAALIQNLKCNKGATISGITLNVDVTAKTAAGFVRWYDKNNKTTINITDCAYLGNITGTDYASAIFGGGVNGTLNIENVVVGSKTEKTTITGKNRVGAFFSEPSGQGGAAEAKNNVINVTNCVNYADIKQISNGNEGCAGSLAGRFCFVTVNVDSFTNYGDVDSKRTTTWQQGVGGVIGEINQNAYANLENVVNYGDVYSNAKNVAGIVGLVTNRSYLVIRDSENYGKVSNGTGWQFSVGGFVAGAAFGDNGTTLDDSPENTIEIYDSVNYGEVVSTGSNAGGFIGMVEKNTEASKIVVDGCTNFGYIHGNNNNAGILGQVTGHTVTVNNCENYGTIETVGGTAGAAGITSYVHGGAITNLTITNNTNYGTINSSNHVASGIVLYPNVVADKAAVEDNPETEANEAQPAVVGTGIISGNTNYGIVIAAAGKDTIAIIGNVDNVDQFLDNVNYGVLASATNGILSPAVTESETMTAVVNEGVLLTDADLIAIAKALNPMWYYTEEEWFGTAAVEPEAPEAPEVPETSDEVVEEVAPANDGEEVTEPVEVLGILEALKAAQAVKENVKAAQALVEALTADYEEAAAALTEAEAALEAAKKVVDELAGTSNTEALEEATEALVVADQNHASAILAKTEASTALETATAIADDLAANQEDDRAAAVEALNASIASALDRTEMIDLYFDLMKLDTENLGIDAEAWMEAVTKMEEATTQEDLDAAVSEMKAILAAAIDYSALQAQWERYEALDLEDYTAASVRDLNLVVEKIMEYEVEDLTQAIVDELAAELKAAIDALRDDFYIIEDAIIFVESIDALDPEDYTAPTWAIVKELRDELVAAIEAEDLDEVESLIYIIELAIVEQLIEVGTLKDLVAEIEALDEANYSNFSWINVPSAVVIAKTILTAVEEETIEKDTAEAYIAEAIAFVTEVLEGLVDVSELKANIADAKAEAEGNYTVATLAALKTAIANAEITVSIAKTAEEVEAANKALVAAIDALEELVEVDASTLEELIAAVEALNAADYTAATWAAVKEALAAAKIAVNAAAQADVDAAFAALDAAKTALVTKPNTEALAGAIADVEALVAGDYTAETWAVLVEALKAAKAALASDVQADVDAAKAALDTAKAALAAKVAADTSALSALIAEIEALKSADYTSDSWATLKAALDAAKAVLDSDDQNAIDLAKALLDVAKAGLTKVEVDAPEVDDEDEDDDETDKPATTEPAKKKGCGSVIGATAVVLTAVLGLGATVVLKKKED